MVGVIYCYTSPSNKKYIGQTISEVKRRSRFKNLKLPYAGIKFDNARKKYGPENFTYEVLEKKSFKNKEECLKWLNEKEVFYIEKYNTYKKGYNSTEGGYNCERDDELKSKLSKKAKERYKGKMPDHLKKCFVEAHEKAINACKKQVDQLDNDGNVIKTWSSAEEAGKFFGLKRGTAILSCARGKFAKSCGYRWKFHNEDYIAPEVKSAVNAVGKYDLEGNLIEQYCSVKDAATNNDIVYHVLYQRLKYSIKNNKMVIINNYWYKYI